MKSLDLVSTNAEEARTWITGLKYLMAGISDEDSLARRQRTRDQYPLSGLSYTCLISKWAVIPNTYTYSTNHIPIKVQEVENNLTEQHTWTDLIMTLNCSLTWLQQTFSEADKNGDGTLSIGEVHQLLHKLNVNLPKQKVRQMFQVRLKSTKVNYASCYRRNVHDPPSKLYFCTNIS